MKTVINTDLNTYKMKRKEATIKKLWTALKLLDNARLSVIKQNENGKQFDYVSDPKLSDVIDRINKVTNNLDWIIYQKSK
jgi:hypothetical protein